jgi:hypothetical protein
MKTKKIEPPYGGTYAAFLVTCLDDTPERGGKPRRILATRQTFKTEEDARKYAKGVSRARRPQLLPCPFDLLTILRK